jgi:hypothetical protein
MGPHEERSPAPSSHLFRLGGKLLVFKPLRYSLRTTPMRPSAGRGGATRRNVAGNGLVSRSHVEDLSRGQAIVTSRVHPPLASPGLDLLRLSVEHPIVRPFPARRPDCALPRPGLPGRTGIGPGRRWPPTADAGGQQQLPVVVDDAEHNGSGLAAPLLSCPAQIDLADTRSSDQLGTADCSGPGVRS